MAPCSEADARATPRSCKRPGGREGLARLSGRATRTRREGAGSWAEITRLHPLFERVGTDEDPVFCSLLCSSQGYSLSAVNWNSAAIRLPVKTNSWLFQKAGSTTLHGIGCRISFACCCVPARCRTVARHLLSLRFLCRRVLTFVAVQSSAHYISHQLP